MHRRSLFGDTRNEPLELDEPPEPLMDTPAPPPALAAHTTPIAQTQQQAQRRILTVEEFMRAPQRYQNCLFKSESIVDFYSLMQLTLSRTTDDRIRFLNAINCLFRNLNDEEKITFLSKLNTQTTPLAITNQFIQWPLLDDKIKKIEAAQPYAMRVQIQTKCNDATFNKRSLLYLLGKLITHPKESSITYLEIIRLLNPNIEKMKLYERIDIHLEGLAAYYQQHLLQNLRNSQDIIGDAINTFQSQLDYLNYSSEFFISMIIIGEAFSRHLIKINAAQFNRFMDILAGLFHCEDYREFQCRMTSSRVDPTRKIHYKFNYLRESIFALYDRCLITPHYVDYFLNSHSTKELNCFEQLSETEKSNFWDEVKTQLIEKTLLPNKIEYILDLIRHIRNIGLDYSQSSVERFIKKLLDFRNELTENLNENTLINAFFEEYESEYGSSLIMTP